MTNKLVCRKALIYMLLGNGGKVTINRGVVHNDYKFQTSLIRHQVELENHA